MTKAWSVVLLWAVVAAVAPSLGQEPDLGDFGSISPMATANLRAAAVASHTAVTAGQEFLVAVEVTIGSGWVYYSPDPGDIAKPGVITVKAEGLNVGELLWPADQIYETDLGGGEKVVNNVYKKRAVIYVPLTVPARARPGRHEIAIRVGGQICGNVCIDVGAGASANVTVGAESLANKAWTDELAGGLSQAVPAAKLSAARTSAAPPPPAAVEELTIWSGLGLALLAGLILNVMPCVLPVIPLRVLSLVKMAGQQRRRFIALGLAFAGGIVLLFAALAVANIVVTLVAQQTLNLNMHFQYRSVRVALALVLVGLAGNLFGLFHVTVPTKLAGLGQGGAQANQGYLAVTGMGVMMALLATPCSFAILAVALAWAQTQPLWLGTLAILAIGVGMAAPHAALVAVPNLVNKLPKPGPWMEMLRHGMGLLLLPVAVWLIFAGSKDTYPGWVIAYAVVLTICLWVWGKWVRYDAPLGRKLVVRGLAVLLAVAAGIWMLTPSKPTAVAFEPFSHQRIDDAHSQGQTVLVKFTSATCLSCIWLDRTVYNDPEVAAELDRRGIVTVKADTTDANTPAAKMLKQRFRGAPPLTVLLPPDAAEPVRLDGKFTKAKLFEALKAIGPSDGGKIVQGGT